MLKINKLIIFSDIVNEVIHSLADDDIAPVQKFINKLYEFNIYTLDKNISSVYDKIVEINQDVITDFIFKLYQNILLSELGDNFLEENYKLRTKMFKSNFVSIDLKKYVIPNNDNYDPYNEVIIILRYTLSKNKYVLIENA